MKLSSTIKRCLPVAGALLMGFASSDAATPVRNVSLTRNGSDLEVAFTADLSSLNVRSSQAVLLTPVLANQGDSTTLRSIGIYGRNRYYYYLRNESSMISGADEISYRANSAPDSVQYRALIPYENWMDGARLRLDAKSYGCCETLLASASEPVGSYNAPQPVAEVVETVTEPVEQIFTLSGAAFVHFPLDVSILYEDFMNNPRELAKIRAGIDSLESIPGIEVRGITLKGFASPEGTYAHNTELARDRTQALKEYVDKLYNFSPDVVSVAYEPEDWAGFRRWVEASQLPHRTEILAIIDGPLEPDARDAKIRSTYPAEYAKILKECYPSLRHTEYTIAYTVRSKK
jgi:outer membrane protein OmpA-like peptidoglycan-associated protein